MFRSILHLFVSVVHTVIQICFHRFMGWYEKTFFTMGWGKFSPKQFPRTCDFQMLFTTPNSFSFCCPSTQLQTRRSWFRIFQNGPRIFQPDPILAVQPATKKIRMATFGSTSFVSGPFIGAAPSHQSSPHQVMRLWALISWESQTVNKHVGKPVSSSRETWEEPKRKAGSLTLFVALLEQIIPSKGFHFGKRF